MNYLKDINILGYIDARGDIAKVSKTSLINQKIKNILNQKSGDLRLSDISISFSLDDYKFTDMYGTKIMTLTFLYDRVKNIIKEIDDITLNPTFGSNTITFDVSYSIFDNVVKNLKNSTFKFTIDK
jgi:hypothetical protein